MVAEYKKGDYGNGKGVLCDTVDGPMYKVKDMWVSPLAYRAAKILSQSWGVSEKVALSKMIEQYVASSCKIEDRLELYKKEVLPKLIEKEKNKSREKHETGE